MASPPVDNASAPTNSNYPIDLLKDAIGLIFSWILLMPIAVVIGGKLLAQNISLPLGDVDNDIFDIRVPPLFRIRATRSQVVLGFNAFVITFVAVGFVGGKPLYNLFITDFGIDPGQWNGLCILSAFFSVCWTWIISLFLFFQYGSAKGNMVRDSIIDQLSQRGPGAKIDLPDDQYPKDTAGREADAPASAPEVVAASPTEIRTGTQDQPR